jgi:hypothetical protein
MDVDVKMKPMIARIIHLAMVGIQLPYNLFV